MRRFEFEKPDTEEEIDISLEGREFTASIIFVPCESFSRFQTHRKKKKEERKKERKRKKITIEMSRPREKKEKKRSLPSIRGTLKKTK